MMRMILMKAVAVLIDLWLHDDESTSCSEEAKYDCTDRDDFVNPNRTVSFSTVQIREYNVIVGDNPFCKTGLPLGLGWKYTQGPAMDIDQTTTTTVRRKHYSEYRLCANERKERLLLVSKYALEELDQMEVEFHRERQEAEARKQKDQRRRQKLIMAIMQL
eukprot:CAMPEP_0118719256 /NCGR_PEP_ID=MMETSP0800-20121206/29352_1 /TAXON_ID=210618 ORGANISM="Striatella unipunctata, Strain CCMP2910" /NCGR_SAMPLE_ID=MMETSP0800 /ASSEMBLY_ACC=CAM_ASM_000638 /LENGTH=160 /DNA_ID=CAMNT_0006626561 /DNA_START=47 /DNA_END=529 /DNA_ORIENTATION=-